MEISGKIWGTTSKLFAKNNVEVHRIEGRKGGKSSTHRHNSKISMFFVEFGSIKVCIEKLDYTLTDTTIISKGQSTVIYPGEYHWFEMLEDSVAYEIYWTEIDSNDIERKNVGSINL